MPFDGKGPEVGERLKDCWIRVEDCSIVEIEHDDLIVDGRISIVQVTTVGVFATPISSILGELAIV